MQEIPLRELLTLLEADLSSDEDEALQILTSMQIEEELEELFGRGMDDFVLVITHELYGRYGA